MAGVLEEAGTADPSITPEFTPVFGGVGGLVFGVSSSCVLGVAIVSALSILDCPVRCRLYEGAIVLLNYNLLVDFIYVKHVSMHFLI